MKRILFEWGSIVSLAMALAIAAFWVATEFFVSTSYYLQISTFDSLGYDLYLIAMDGDATLATDIDMDASGRFRPYVVGPPVGPDIVRGDRFRQFTIPGFDTRYYVFAPHGHWIWSLRLSLLIPAVLSFLLALLFRRRLRRLRNA